MPLMQTSGNATADAYAGGAAAAPLYIEDFFQSYLRTGTGASATVTTGLDGSTKETLVWTKSRSAATNYKLTDNVRGATKALSSNTTGAEATDSQGLTAFSATGYTIGTNTDYNNSGATYVDWQWVAQPKFFDVVTYTGNGTTRSIAHNLGSVPGSIIVKRLNFANDWAVYHRATSATPADDITLLNSTAATYIGSGGPFWGSTAPTATDFTVNTALNSSGGFTYVAYLFAHDAGGFGLTGTDNVISCGSYTGNLTVGNAVTLGYEPQWVLVKRATGGTGSWYLYDTMRGMTANAGGNSNPLNPNTADAEGVNNDGIAPSATGFTLTSTSDVLNGSGFTYIYIAIRRGPMKVPTLGTSVFAPVAATTGTQTAGFPIDMMMQTWRGFSSALLNTQIVDRLRGVSSTSTPVSKYLITSSTGAEDSGGATSSSKNWNNVGFDTPPDYAGSAGGNVFQCFKRAPGFFDEVCYSGNGANDRQVTHNLGVAPELIICKSREYAWPWWVGGSVLGSTRNGIYLNETVARIVNADAFSTNGAAFTSSYFLVSNVSVYPPNPGSGNQVAYLFATCPGVSKVGSYTGTGALQTVNCGFTSGARFVLIKRTDSTGDWWTYDSARGITSGDDPYLFLNSPAAEVTSTNYVDTDSTGFKVTAAAPAKLNASGGSFIFFAVA